MEPQTITPVIRYKVNNAAKWWSSEYETLEEAQEAAKATEQSNLEARKSKLIVDLVAKEFTSDLLGPSREQLCIANFLRFKAEIAKSILKQADELQ